MIAADREETPLTGWQPQARRIGFAAALLALAIVAYASALRNAYVNFDDGVYIVVYPNLNGLDGLANIWTGQGSNFYYPLVFTSFWVEKQVEQALGLIGADKPPNAQVNHALNILLHALTGILLWICLRRLNMPPALAWIAAALWIVHPLQVQSVVWATERKNTLSGLFCIAATLAWLRANGRMRSGSYVASLFLFAGAMLSKWAFLLLPFIWLLLEWVARRALRPATVVRILPFLGIAAVFAVLALNSGHRVPTAESPSLSSRFVIAGFSLSFYLWKLCWPTGIAAIYERWDAPATTLNLVPLALWCLAGFAWLCYGFVRRMDQSRTGAVILIATAHYVLMLAPALGLIPFGSTELSFVLNHHAYLALVGPIVLAVLGGARILRRIAPRSAAVAGVVVLIGVLASISFSRSLVWKNTATLTEDIVRVTPTCAAAYRMHAMHIESEQPRAALEKMRKAVELRPDYAEAHYELGRMLLLAGEEQQAVDHLRAALALPPIAPHARCLLARLFVKRQAYEAAIREFEALPPTFPLSPELLDTWARCLSHAGRLGEALEKARDALEQAPEWPKSYELVASLLLRLNRYTEALSKCNRLLAIEPQSARGLLLRGQCHLARGEPDAAERDFQAALVIAPRYRAAVEKLRQRPTTRPTDAAESP